MNLLIVAICVNLLSVSNHYCNFKIIIEVQSMIYTESPQLCKNTNY